MSDRRMPRRGAGAGAGASVALLSATLLSLAALLFAAPAEAQSKAELSARQEALYQDLLASPDDPRIMFEYARVSAELENFEGAISTLQRLLLFQPNNTAAKVELGALYFAIGSYTISEQYFREALAAPELDNSTRIRIGSFLAEIERRTATNRFEGEVILGAIASTNAGFSPSTSEFSAVDGGTITLDSAEQEDAGLRLRVSLLHSYDLQRPNDDRWDTEIDFDGRVYEDSASLNFAAASIRTGPELSVDPSITGLKVRPFAEAGVYSSDDRITFYTVGGGAEARAAFDDQWSASGEIRALWRAFAATEDDQFDGVESRGVASLRYAPGRNLAFRATGLVEREDAQFSGGRSTAGGGQLSGVFAYDAPIADIRQKWVIDVTARAIYRRFDAPDPEIETGVRDQVDMAVGASHRFQLTEAWGVLAEIDYQIREASNKIYEFRALTGGLSASFRF